MSIIFCTFAWSNKESNKEIYNNNNMTHFKIEEFYSPDMPGSGQANMDPTFLSMIDNAREESGVPYRINSGWRSIAHNKKIGGKVNSSHLYGLAADIHCIDSRSRSKILKGLNKAGFTRIGIADTFIHADCDISKPQSVTFLY